MQRIVLVERLFDPPATDDVVGAQVKALGPCLGARDVRHVTSYLAEDRKSMVCVFEAPDTETVRDGFHSAGVAVARVWPAARLG